MKLRVPLVSSNFGPAFENSPNGKIMLWDYQIELDVGDLSFTATGFTQTVRKPPIFSTSQALGERGEAS